MWYNPQGKNDTQQKKTINKLLFIIIGFCIALILSYIFTSVYYNTHFYPNTTINGIDVSNMTVQRAEEKIQKQFKAYFLTLQGRDNLTGQIHGMDFDIQAKFDETFEDLMDAQNSLLWPGAFFTRAKIDIGTVPEYREDILKDLVVNLPYFQDENIVRPVNAYISEYTKKNGYEIVPEIIGNQVHFDILFETIRAAIDNLLPMVSLEEVGCYVNPEITSESPGLVQVVKELNKIAGTEIIYVFGKDKEILDGSLINGWLSISEDNGVVLDEGAVKEYVDYIGKNYNSFGRTRTFKTSYGRTIKIKGGDYGWWLNRPQETMELMELILAGEKTERKPVYFQTAQQYGSDDVGGTYVEVNLTAQHLFFYKNGKLIMETDFVSGNLSKGYGTPTGTYPVQYKERNATLVGEDYSTPVEYWMPFNRGIGFHDATWRSTFGKDIYKTNGSHGCINMPPKAARTMFENIQRGVAVIVYELSGTK